MKDGCYFMPLGGHCEIGMNLNLFGICKDGLEQWIIMDAGVTMEKSLGIRLQIAESEQVFNRNVIGMVFSHGHDDHIGAIPFLIKRFKTEIPIFATNFTLRLIKDKLINYSIEHNNFNEVFPEEEFNVGDFFIKFTYITHSLPEPNMVLINFKLFNHKLLHSGDWKFDNDPVLGEPVNKMAIKAVGDLGIDTFLCDSTNALEKERTASEGEAQRNLEELIKEYYDHRIFIACFASNVARMIGIIEAAKKLGKIVILYGRSILRIKQIASDSGHFPNYTHVFEIDALHRFAPSNTIVICTGSQAENGAILYKLAYGFQNKMSIASGDVVVFSSRKIPGNEKAIVDLQNALIMRGAKVLDSKNYKRIHVSGHPSRPEIEEMLQLIRPKCLIPTHGQPINFDKMKEIGTACKVPNMLIISNGDLVDLIENKIVGKYHVSRDCIDGKQIVSINASMFKVRAALGTNGAVFISIYNTFVKISFHGLVPIEICNSKNFIIDVQKMIGAFLKEHSSLEKKEKIKMLSSFIADYIRVSFEKDPVVVIHILNYDYNKRNSSSSI